MDPLLNFTHIEQDWLHPFSEGSASERLGISLSVLANQLEGYVDAGQDLQAWEFYDQLLRQAVAQHKPEEIGEVEVICAGVELKIGRPKVARHLLLAAAKRFLGDEHSHAIVVWLLGIACWQQAGDARWEAISHWEESRGCLIALSDNIRQNKGNAQWYSERCQEIELFLKSRHSELKNLAATAPPIPSAQSAMQPAQVAQQTLTVQPLLVSEQPTPVSEEAPAISEPPTQLLIKPKIYPPKDWIDSFPILPGAVSAGTMKHAIESNPGQFEHILIPFLEIDGHLYEIFSLRGSNILPHLGSRSTYAFRVQGDSMDGYDPPILPNDYVLINTNLGWQTGDVVVTQVLDETDEPLNNLKILISVSEDEIILRYKSKNPRHKYEDGRDKEFFIQAKKHKNPKILGVAVARLKQVEPEDETS